MRNDLKRDEIDFEKTDVSRLFFKLFVPTLLGLLFGGLLNLADGIFVGRGVGSDALAAVNVAAPVFMLATGTALLFGSGVSVVAAIHLSHGNIKAANINVTQALTVSVALLVVLALLCVFCPAVIAHLFGGEGRIVSYACDYLRNVAPGLVFTEVVIVGMFVLRLDASPKYAMYANITASVLNIFLDWLFVFPFGWGISGAAIATSLSETVGALMIIAYFIFPPHQLRLYKPKFSRKAILLTARNVGYMAKMGLSSFIGEIAISVMIILGNYHFMPMLHEEGVAAYSVACYLFPIVFMFGNAIAQSSLPIISYSYGRHDTQKIRRTVRLSFAIAVVFGLAITIAGYLLSSEAAALFIGTQSKAYGICADGLPYFSFGYLFFTLNIVLIGFYQATKHPRQATFFMLLRSCIALIPIFALLPDVLGVEGLWLAVPVSECLTFLCICLDFCFRRGKGGMTQAKA